MEPFLIRTEGIQSNLGDVKGQGGSSVPAIHPLALAASRPQTSLSTHTKEETSIESRFDVNILLFLLQCDERCPDTLFLWFEHVVKARDWTLTYCCSVCFSFFGSFSFFSSAQSGGHLLLSSIESQ